MLGAEPANADDAARSFASGTLQPLAATTTIADGLRTTLSRRTLAALRAHVDAFGTCSEAAIVRAMRMMFERMKQVVEPSSAVPLACLLERTLDVAGKRVGIIVSGGNVDLDRLPGRHDRASAADAPRRGAAMSEPLLDVRGVTLQYKTKDHLVTATYRVDFDVHPLRPLHPARSVRLRQVDAAEGGRRLHEAGRRRDPAEGRGRDAARVRTG